MRLTSTLVVALLLGLTACGGGGTDLDEKPPRPALRLDFESSPDAGQDVAEVRDTGSGSAKVSVETSGAAELESVEGPDGGHAVRFPAYTGAAVAPAAVIVAQPGKKGSLDPGKKDFHFGATFNLDADSSGSEADNGDNLVQRGTFDSPGQFKIQIDKDLPSCRVLGDDGEVFVAADRPVETGRWYTASCARAGDEVSLTVTPYDDPDDARTWRATGPTGNISLPGLPLAVGGKVSPEGVPVASADQFNGAVDDVLLVIE